MSDAAVDPAVFIELQESMGADFAQELVTTFLAEAPGMIADLNSAQEAGDQDGFRRAAHSIKSNADVFGAAALSGLARQMELAGPTDPSAQDIATLEAEYLRAAASLKALAHG